MAKPVNDVQLPDDLGAKSKLLSEKHADYLASYGEGAPGDEQSFDYCMTEYLRLSGVYWGLTCMSLLGQLERMDRKRVLAFVKSCQKSNGGVSASPGHDAHLLYALSAVQVGTDSCVREEHNVK